MQIIFVATGICQGTTEGICEVWWVENIVPIESGIALTNPFVKQTNFALLQTEPNSSFAPDVI